jgi:hypothetical protein
VLVMAANTDNRLTRDLMFDAVPYSCVNMAADLWRLIACVVAALNKYRLELVGGENLNLFVAGKH